MPRKHGITVTPPGHPVRPGASPAINPGFGWPQPGPLNSVRTVRRALPLALATVVLLAGCVPAEPKLDPQTGAGLDAVVAAFRALSADDQLAAIATHDARAERELWRLTGLENALGGADAADQSFAAMQQGLTGTVAALRQPLTLVPAAFTTGQTAADNVDEALGGGMFGQMIGGALLDDAAMENTDGSDQSGSEAVGDDGNANVSSQNGTVSTSLDIHTTYKGVEVTIHTESQVTPCPDPQGKVHAEGTYSLIVEAAGGRGAAQQIQVQDDIVVDDDANQASSEYSYDVGYADSAASGGTRQVDLSVDRNGAVKVHNSMGGATDDFLDDAMKTGAFFAAWMANSLEKAAQKGWESGRCIDLTVAYSDGPSGLDTDQKVDITATPVAKSDGQPAGGTVTATLTSGSTSVSPEGQKVPAAAHFTFTAPSKKDESGTVHLESRSKRGVGKLDATLDTKKHQAYKIVPVTNLAMSGVICDLTQPFDVAGGGLTSHHVPTNENGGTYTLSGSVGGSSWTGKGTYTVTLSQDKKRGTMVIDGTATGHTPAGTITNPAHEVIDLVATDSC